MDQIIEISTSQIRTEQSRSEIIDDDKNRDTRGGRNKNSKCLFSLLNILKSIFLSSDSVILTLLVLMNLILIFYEFFCGISTRSLNMISDALHGFIHIGSFIFALLAFILSKRASNFHYTYGYSRIETLSAFINAFFLCFLGGFAFGSKIHHIIENIDRNHDHSEKSADALTVDVLKALYNILGALLFSRFSLVKPTLGIDERQGHIQNFHTIFLHFTLDGLMNLLVIIDNLYEDALPPKMDIVFSGFVFLLTIIFCKPVLKSTGLVLLQAFPIKDEEFVSSVLREISVVEGVLNIREKRFWGVHWGYLVCSLKILVRKDVNKEESLKDILHTLKPKFKNVCIEFEYDH